ncbi:MAG: pyridoxal kinase PdxY [Solirubrobacterales bacterium]
MKILSFQSAVAYGHVGNSAAVFPLQRMGFDVWPVDTVQFSNHPGYGSFRGKILTPEHVREIVHGLDEAGALETCDAVLSGYLGDADTGEAALLAVAQVKAIHPGAPYLCDPVMGDVDTGVYVRPGVPEFIAAQAIPAADIVTPNRFELGLLTGLPTAGLKDCAAAARALLTRGPRVVVVTSVEEPGTIACLVVTHEGAWAVRTPKLPMRPAANGAGDALAAMILAHILRGQAAPEAVSMAVSSLFGVLETTIRLHRRELALVAAQDEIAAPTRLFPPLPLD